MLRPLALIALLLFGAWPAGAQDARLALHQGQPDLALFALTRTEDAVSATGHGLLRLQGFLHDPAGPALQPLSQGQALVPVLRHDRNVNGGIPGPQITLGGLAFQVDQASRAKSGFLFGLRYSRWRSLSFGRAARLSIAQSHTVELEPAHGYHRLSSTARICAEQPLFRWTWAEGCLTGLFDHDGVESQAGVTASAGMRTLFRSPLGFHQAALTLARSRQDGADKTLVQVAGQSLTRFGLIGSDLALGQRVPGRNTLRSNLGIGWTGRVAGRTASLRLSQARTDGAVLFGTPRSDRITRLSVETPLSRLDLGAYAERRRSSIGAYDRNDVGVTLGLRVDLLK